MADPLDDLVVQAGVAPAVIVDGLGHVGEIQDVGVGVGDALVVVFDDVDLLLGLQRSGQHLVHVAALELDVHLRASLGFKSRGGLGDDVGLGLAGGPHGPHGQLHALVLLVTALGSLALVGAGLGLGGIGLRGLGLVTAGVGAAGQHGQHHNGGQQQSHELLHFHFLPPEMINGVFGRLRPFQI